MAWVVNVDYGSGDTDIAAYVDNQSFRRKRVLHRDLKPVTDTLKFDMLRNVDRITDFLDAALGQQIAITVTDGGSDYFTGYVRDNYKIKIGPNVGATRIECVDKSVDLQKRMTWTDLWTDYKVGDTGDTSASIIHQLLIEAGFTGDTDCDISTINETIDYYSNVAVANKRTYWQAMSELLYQFGYVWYFDVDGLFHVWSFLHADTSTSNAFDNTNMIGELRITKRLQQYEGARIQWSPHVTESDVIVFSDTTDGDADNKCAIDIVAGDYYPTGGDTDIPVYAEYEYKGYKIITVASPALEMVKHADITQERFTNRYRRADVLFQNDNAGTQTINKFDIRGDCTYIAEINFTEQAQVADTEKLYEFEAEYITTAADATALASGLSLYFKNGRFIYETTSKIGDTYALGTFVDVQDSSLTLNNRCCIIGKEDIDERVGNVRYTMVGAGDYTAQSISVEGQRFPNYSAWIGAHNVKVAASGYAGYADYYCDGDTTDAAVIQAAIDLVAGGVVELSPGTFIITEAIELSSGEYIVGAGPATILEKNCNDYCIEAVGSDGSEVVGVGIKDMTITRDSGDTNGEPLVYLEYCTNARMSGCVLKNWYKVAVRLEDTEGSTITGNDFHDTTLITCGSSAHAIVLLRCRGTTIISNKIHDLQRSRGCGGIYVLDSGSVEISGNQIYDIATMLAYNAAGAAAGISLASAIDPVDDARITNNWISNIYSLTDVAAAISINANANNTQVKSNTCIDNGNLIDRGNCESATEPMFAGETVAVAPTDGTFARSGADKYEGTYSWLGTKSTAGGAGTFSAHLSDSVLTTDLHGLVAGLEYSIFAYGKVPVAGDISRYQFIFRYYDSAAWTYEYMTMTGAAAWELLSGNKTIPGTATAVGLYMQIGTDEAVDSLFYLDNIRIQPIGVHNEHSQQFSDAGTGTSLGDNSWNNVVRAASGGLVIP